MLRILFVTCTLLCVGSAAAQSTPTSRLRLQTLPEERPPVSILEASDRVLIIGDSLVSGTGVKRPDSLGPQFAAQVPAFVESMGKPGEISEHLVTRLGQVLAREDYDWVILVTGGNDMLRGKDQHLERNLVAAIRAVRADGARPVLVAIPRPRTQDDHPAYRRVGAALRVPVLEGLGARLPAAMLLRDGIHPNAEGYRVAAQALSAFFAR